MNKAELSIFQIPETTLTFPTLRFGALLLLSLLQALCACSDSQPFLPLPPPMLVTTEEDAFGTSTRSLDTHYWTQVWDRAEAKKKCVSKAS